MSGTRAVTRLKKVATGIARSGRKVARTLWGAILETRKTLMWFGVVIVVFAAFVGLLALLRVIEIDFVVRMWSTGYGPLETTLILTVASFLLGFFGAMPLGVVRAY